MTYHPIYFPAFYGENHQTRKWWNFHLLQGGAKNKNPKKMVIFVYPFNGRNGRQPNFKGAGNWWLEDEFNVSFRIAYFSEANCVGLRGDTVTQTAGHEFVSGNPSKIIGFPYIWTSTLIPPYFWIKIFVIGSGFRCESFGRFFVPTNPREKKNINGSQKILWVSMWVCLILVYGKLTYPKNHWNLNFLGVWRSRKNPA